MSLKWIKSGLVILAPACAFLLGCIGDTPEPTPLSFVAIYHASPDAPGLDVYLNSEKINSTAFQYEAYSGYVPVDVGANTFTFTQSGSTATLTGAMSNFAENASYSIFLVDEFSALDAWLFEDVTITPGSGNAAIRVVHTSPDTAPLYLTYDSETTSVSGDVAFREIPAFQSVPAGAHDFYIRDFATGDILLTVEENLQVGFFYTLIVKGFSNPPVGGNGLEAEILGN